ncbi:MAG TPA: DUF2092 domain-containing protein [Armatimonadota bacterium]|nr:DUF2092 domain-containing protein [Armatimonadota bacterium]
MRIHIPAAAAVLTMAMAVPALAGPHTTIKHAAPTATKPAAPKLSGSGARYLVTTGKILSGAHTLHVKGHATVTTKATKGPSKTQTAAFEMALGPGGRFMSRNNGKAGEQLLVSTGSAIYIYRPAAKQVVKLPASDAAQGASSVYGQLMLLMGVGPRTWTYKGVHTVNNRPCDEVTAELPGHTSTIYLDRATHLPRRVVLTGKQTTGSGGLTADFDLFQMNGAVPASLFKFTPPRGVKVIVPPARPTAPPVK